MKGDIGKTFVEEGHSLFKQVQRHIFRGEMML